MKTIAKLEKKAYLHHLSIRYACEPNTELTEKL